MSNFGMSKTFDGAGAALAFDFGVGAASMVSGMMIPLRFKRAVGGC
jgi:hypothetical protein